MIPSRLTDIRTRVLKWSQQKLADELGYARNSVSRMELGKQPIELVAELAIYWLMYRECQIVCTGFPEDDLMPEKPIELQQDVATNEMQHGVATASGSQFIPELDYFLKYEEFSELESDARSDFIKRLDSLIIEFFPLNFGPFEHSALDAYMALSSEIWFNVRKGRAFFREHYRNDRTK